MRVTSAVKIHLPDGDFITIEPGTPVQVNGKDVPTLDELPDLLADPTATLTVETEWEWWEESEDGSDVVVEAVRPAVVTLYARHIVSVGLVLEEL